MLRKKEFFSDLLYHPLVAAGPIPTIEDPEGIYPYVSFCETSKRPVIKSFQMLSIENDYLRVTICPDLGGRVQALYDKRTNKEILYDSGAVRAARILPRMAFISGGIEVSFPVSHTPVQLEKVCYSSEIIGNRIYAWCGERELRYGMNWTVEFSLGENDDFLTQRTLFYNPASKAYPWMSWSNAAFKADADTQLHFPYGKVLYHGGELKHIDWLEEGPKVIGNTDRMIGYFWENPDCNAFGVYSPKLGCGLYHIADRAEMPGIKLWLYGIGKHEAWAHLSGISKQAYVEIQAGPIKDQSIKHDLKPGERHIHTEFWIPVDKPVDIRNLILPSPNLVTDERIPLYDFVDRPDTRIWMLLHKAYQLKLNEAVLSPPDWFSCIWPPSGIEQFGEELLWAASHSMGEASALWKYYAAVWYAGTENYEQALSILKNLNADYARLMEARILRAFYKDAASAAKAILSIKTDAVMNHPQVVIERDLCLSALRDEFLSERKAWLDKVNALQDEGLLERKIAYLLDSGKNQEALELFDSTIFEPVHQRYERTKLWQRLEEALGGDLEPPVSGIGEDDLAQFGAYRIKNQ